MQKQKGGILLNTVNNLKLTPSQEKLKLSIEVLQTYITNAKLSTTEMAQYIEMTKKQYEKLLNSYTELEIAGFTQEQFEFEMEHNYQTVSSNTIFIQNMIKYDEFGKVEANIENILTEEEYENEREKENNQ